MKARFKTRMAARALCGPPPQNADGASGYPPLRLTFIVFFLTNLYPNL
jgi:hypothetical protein